VEVLDEGIEVIKVVPGRGELPGAPIDLTAPPAKLSEATLERLADTQREEKIPTGLSWWKATKLTNAWGKWGRIKARPHACHSPPFQQTHCATLAKMRFFLRAGFEVTLFWVIWQASEEMQEMQEQYGAETYEAKVIE